MSMLEHIQSPADVKKLPLAEVQKLAAEMRHVIIQTVARNAGHLAPNLGVVELTLALHRVFDSPTDKIIWDVGHQSYPHKLLTGRYGQFHTLRQLNGIAGYPRRSESAHDPFGTSHGSTSIAAALGYCAARDLKGEKNHVIAVIGDGALTGGMAFEGLNNAGELKKKLIVILNDNEMSISPNIGAIHRYLTKLTTSRVYRAFERDVWELLGKLPRGGKKAQEAAQDPLVQLQQAELQIKQAEVQSKTQKAQSEIAMNQAKLQIEQDKIKLEMMKVQNQKEIEMARLQEQTRSNNQKVQVDLFKRGAK